MVRSRERSPKIGLSQLSIKTRIETSGSIRHLSLFSSLSQLSIKTRIETRMDDFYEIMGDEFESAIH